MNNILIVEDDNDINKLLNDLLKTEYSVTSAFSGTEALMIFSNMQEKFDLILLDLMLPGKNGEEVIKHIRKTSSVPIIVITAKGDIQTLVSVLEIGADDYISKPFDTREVKARIKTHLRKINSYSSYTESEVLNYENIKIDLSTREISADGVQITLTQKEFDLLALFVNEPKRVFTKEILYTIVWGDAYYGDDNTINVHISRLRSKLRDYVKKDIIETVWGVGFRLNLKK